MLRRPSLKCTFLSLLATVVFAALLRSRDDHKVTTPAASSQLRVSVTAARSWNVRQSRSEGSAKADPQQKATPAETQQPRPTKLTRVRTKSPATPAPEPPVFSLELKAKEAEANKFAAVAADNPEDMQAQQAAGAAARAVQEARAAANKALAQSQQVLDDARLPVPVPRLAQPGVAMDKRPADSKFADACPALRGPQAFASEGLPAKTVEANCPGMGSANVFLSTDGVKDACDLENDLHQLVYKYLPNSSTVLELGGRRGTTSCAISNALNHSGKMIVVEPEPRMWPKLYGNRLANGCNFSVLQGIVATKPAVLERKGYGTKTHPISQKESILHRGPQLQNAIYIQNYKLDKLQADCGLHFDALVVDCEGCFHDFLWDNQLFFIRQLVWLFFEKDDKKDWSSAIRLLGSFGFEKVEVQDDKVFEWTEEVYRHKHRAQLPLRREKLEG